MVNKYSTAATNDIQKDHPERVLYWVKFTDYQSLLNRERLRDAVIEEARKISKSPKRQYDFGLCHLDNALAALDQSHKAE